MTLHLAEISYAVAADAHAVVLMDQAGWHLTPKLKIPDNISIIPIPSKSPELILPDSHARTPMGIHNRTL